MSTTHSASLEHSIASSPTAGPRTRTRPFLAGFQCALRLPVLVVDDERLARARLIRMLARIEGVVVAGEAESGEEALAQIAALSPQPLIPTRPSLTTGRQPT